MKNFFKIAASCVLLISWWSQKSYAGLSSQQPVMIINTANPLFQPQYQLVVSTGTLSTPVLSNTLLSQDQFLQSLANARYVGFLYGSLVANGYSTNVTTGVNQTVQNSTISISPNYTLGNQQTSLGLTDITELCKRYGAYIPFVQQVQANFSTAWGPSGMDFNNVMPLPAAQPLMGKNWIPASLFVAPTEGTMLMYTGVDTPNAYPNLQFTSYSVLPFIITQQQQTIFASIIKNVQTTSVFATPLVLLNRSLPQFTQLQNWFTTTVTIQFSPNGFPSNSMPNSLVSIQGVSSTQPYSTAYDAMLNTLYKTSVSVTPTNSSFLAPTGFSSASITQFNLFGNDAFFVPLMMADPLWQLAAPVAATSSNQRSNFTTPYEYVRIKSYEWQYTNGAWVAGEVPVQKIGYAGDVVQNSGGGITVGSDFDPRKSPQSDFYNMLSF